MGQPSSQLTLAVFQALGMIPEEITKLKIFVREDAINVNDNFRRQNGISLRPLALPRGISFTSLRSPPIVIQTQQGEQEDTTKSRKLTRGGLC